MKHNNTQGEERRQETKGKQEDMTKNAGPGRKENQGRVWCLEVGVHRKKAEIMRNGHGCIEPILLTKDAIPWFGMGKGISKISKLPNATR
jgi:hypothetical protein